MRINFRFSWRAVVRAVVLLVGATAVLANAIAQPQRASGAYGEAGDPANQQSFIRIEDTGAPIRKTLKIGMGKSALLEIPRDVRDVMVSNPKVVDAVVLSSNRVFLLARESGEANAFFFDTSGAQF